MLVSVLSVMLGYLLSGFSTVVLLRTIDRWLPTLELGYDLEMRPNDRILAYVLWPLLICHAIWVILLDSRGLNVFERVENVFVDLLSPKKKEE